MNEMINISTVTFTGNKREANVKNALYQYDYGQIIVIDGLELPQAFEVHFSNVGSESSQTRIGVNNSVEIPNEYLTNGADITAYFFLHASDSDGRTRYVINIPVEERPAPEDVEVTAEQEDVITQAINALNDAVELTGEDVESAAAYAQAAAQSAAEAETSAADAAASLDAAREFAEAAEASEGAAAQSAAHADDVLAQMQEIEEESSGHVQWAKTYAENAAASASAAAQSATASASSAGQSADSAAAAIAAADNAETFKDDASDYADAAADSAAKALQYKTAAEQGANDATNKATEAEQYSRSSQTYAGYASTSAVNADASAGAAATSANSAALSAESAEQSAAEASTSAETAVTKAAEAVVSASSASTSAQSASGSATTATTKATEASASASSASTAKNDAVAAKNAAVAAQTAAETAQSKAEDAQDTAESAAQQAVQAAEDIAELASALSEKAGILRDRASGAVASFVPDYTVDNLLGLSVAVEPVQNLNGYDNPWPAGGGKNKINPDNYAGDSVTSNGVTFTKQADGSVKAKGTATATAAYALATANAFPVKAGTYTLSATKSGTADGNVFLVLSGGTLGTGVPYTSVNVFGVNSATFTATADGNLAYVLVQVANGVTVDCILYPMLESGSTPTAYSPYSNICPISGWDSVNIWDKPAYDTTATPTATITLGETVYGGTLDVVNGKMTVDTVAITIDGVNVRANGVASYGQNVRVNIAYPTGFTAKYNGASTFCISDKLHASYQGVIAGAESTISDVRVFPHSSALMVNFPPSFGVTSAQTANEWFAVNTPMVCYPLATPFELTLTPEQIATLQGTNNVWSDAGNVTVDFAADLKTYIDNKIAALAAQIVNS